MYTAKIHDKSFEAGVLRVQVEFTNGTESIFESCVPQDEGGLKCWIKGRLDQLNFAATIDSKYAVGSIVDVSITQTTSTKTQAEIDRDAWVLLYQKWLRVKTGLIDTGILTGNETKVVNLKAKVQSDFLPAYVDFI